LAVSSRNCGTIRFIMAGAEQRGGQPKQVVDFEKAHEMALAEESVREWGKRYQRFQENPALETDPTALKWFPDLQSKEVTSDKFVSHAEKRAEMVGELYDYQQQLQNMSAPRILYEAGKNTYKGYLTRLLSPVGVGVQKEGLPAGVEEEGKKGKFASYMSFRGNVAYEKMRTALGYTIPPQK
jgi:hypothetical protein